MDCIEAINTRISVRAYKPDPVPKELLAEIMEVSLRAPSWANTQTWEFAILGGKVMERVKDLLGSAKLAEGDRDLDIPRPDWPPLYRERRRENGGRLYRLLGITREDREEEVAWRIKMHRYFDAPSGIIIYTDAGLSPYALLNVGLIAQTIALAAVNYGLGTCMIAAGVTSPEKLKRLLEIPDSKALVLALGIGYPQWDALENSFRSNRLPLDAVARFYGF